MYTRGNGLIGPKGSVNNKINKLLSIIVIVVISSINSSTLLFGNSPCLYLDCTLFFAVMTGMMIRNRTPFLLPTDGGETTEKKHTLTTLAGGVCRICAFIR